MQSDLPSTPSAAKAAGERRYFTGKPCPHGHVSTRWAHNGTCCACGVERASAHSKERPDLRAARSKRHREKDIEASREATRKIVAKFRSLNPERSKEIAKAHYDRHQDRLQQKARDYRADNAEIVNLRDRERAKEPARRIMLFEQAAFRRAMRMKATPPWLTKDQRAEIATKFDEARRLRAETGVEHHVDHIEPLIGKTSCGLHVPWNLQVITAEENLKKGNRLLAA